MQHYVAITCLPGEKAQKNVNFASPLHKSIFHRLFRNLDSGSIVNESALNKLPTFLSRMLNCKVGGNLPQTSDLLDAKRCFVNFYVVHVVCETAITFILKLLTLQTILATRA